MSTKAELKENILASKVENLIMWGFKNKKLTIGIGIGLLVIFVPAALITSVIMLRNNKLNDENWTRLAQAQYYMEQRDFDKSKLILETVKNNAPKSDTAKFASYYIGELSLSNKKYDLAIQELTAVVDSKKENPIKPLALSNLGFAYEEKGDFTEAAITYQKFMEQYNEHFLAPRIQLSLGRSLANAGEKDQASQALEQLIDLYPTSPYAENARRILDKLESR